MYIKGYNRYVPISFHKDKVDLHRLTRHAYFTHDIVLGHRHNVHTLLQLIAAPLQGPLRSRFSSVARGRHALLPAKKGALPGGTRQQVRDIKICNFDVSTIKAM